MARLCGSLLVVIAAISAATAAARTPTPRLTITPTVVLRGNPVAVVGSHFRPRLRVALTVRPAKSSKATRFASVAAGASGAFRVSRTIGTSTRPGRYVIVACQRACTTKASGRFSVPKVVPVSPSSASITRVGR